MDLWLVTVAILTSAQLETRPPVERRRAGSAWPSQGLAK